MQRFLQSLTALAVATTAGAQYQAPDPSGLQGIIVERYYIADANDAGDTDGGTGLVQGATTYRVFVDLKPGYKLLTVGGFEAHALTMGTTTTFFNNEDRGEAWGTSINDIHLDVNTVAIDSWLTIGGGSDAHWGVPKADDTDGSMVGGANNDGGSNAVPEGLLVNDVAAMGLPLTTADGLMAGVVPMINAVGTPPDLFDLGGSNSYTNENYAWAVLGGVEAPDTTNRILIGQFTTDGVLSFCFNLFVAIPDELVCDDPACHDFLVFYGNLLPTDTAGTSIANDNLFTHPSLCYTSSSAEVDCEGNVGGSALPGTACDDGNADTTDDTWTTDCNCLGNDCLGVQGGTALPGTACDDGNGSTANDTWQSGCVCEGTVGIGEIPEVLLTVSPNPVRDRLRMEFGNMGGQRVRYTLTDLLGAPVLSEDLGSRTGGWNAVIDVSMLPTGLYLLQVEVGAERHALRIVKL